MLAIQEYLKEKCDFFQATQIFGIMDKYYTHKYMIMWIQAKENIIKLNIVRCLFTFTNILGLKSNHFF